MEGALNAKTATGKTHRMVIEAVSLLGITLPGVSTLEDLTSYYGTEVPEGTEIVEGEAIAAKTIGGGQQVQASVSTEDVRRAFYETLTDDRYFWWVKDIRLDPDELIVEDDDNGDLYRVPYSVAGTDVNFGEPIPSEVVYVDKSDAVAASSHGRSVAAFASRDESRKQEQENEMDPKQIRASLGLAEDATDEEVHSKIASLKAAEEAANKEAPEGGDPAESEDDEEDEDEEDESEAPAGDEAATKVVDAKVWEETVAAAREGQAARKEQLTERREGVLKAAVDQGKIAPASKDEWRKKLRAAPESTEAELEALSPGLLPVKETAIDASAEAKEYAYDESLFPEIRASRTSNDPITREVN